MLLPLLLSAALAAPPDWKTTLDAVVPAVVSIRTNHTRSFDTQHASSSVATGFVVDAEQGLILTNRHVVGPGPAILEAVFFDNEEVPLEVVYRDPVHDFALVRFDPQAVRFMEVPDLPLCADCAQVGLDIRVVGNDAGEKISILPGTIARLDRDAPSYGSASFNDFNTFYIQSASGTSGGSSGSPVLDIEGRVVALNAGSRRQAASSFFLPLDRVIRALQKVKNGQPVSRGGIQAIFQHTTYDEVRRLGLDQETEARVRARFPQGTGLLVVSEVVPGGPADGRLKPGDVLLELEGELLNGFVALEERIDASVGQSLRFRVQRGGKALDLDIPVEDLFAVTPSSYLEFGGGVLGPVSLHQARNNGVPVDGVTVYNPGYALYRAGIPAGAIIDQVNGSPTPDLGALESALAAIPDGTRVPVRYRTLSDPRGTQVAVLPVDHRWFPMQRCTLDPASGDWPCTPSAEAPPPAPPVPGTVQPLSGRRGPARAIAPSLVAVDFDVPYRTEGVYGTSFVGSGLVVDAERGLVVVDRDTVPVALGDATLTFGGSLEVPARVVYLHPVHNIAFLGYDPAALGGTPVEAASFSYDPLEAGDPVWQVGLDGTGQVVARKTRVTRVIPEMIPLPSPPFFRDTNIETIRTEAQAPSVGGVLTDRKGQVQALWASFVDLSGKDPRTSFSGLPATYIQETLEALQAGKAEPWPTLGFEMVPASLAEARHLGLSETDAARLVGGNDKRRVLVVGRITTGSPAEKLLHEGDIILEVEGRPVFRFEEVESALLKGPVPLTVLREGVRMPLILEPHWLSGQGIDRVVGLAGALLHAPPEAIAAQRNLPREGVYVAWYWYGSPAGRHGLRPTHRITAIDGQPVPDLDALLKAVKGQPDRSAIRLSLVDLDGKESVRTLKLDNHYWPPFELQRDEAGAWTRIDH